MTAQPDHHNPPGTAPPMGTLAELRDALSTWGFEDDRRLFEAELDAADLDDLTAVREIVQAYRHRILLRCDPQGAAALNRPAADVSAELRRKLAEAQADAR